MEGEGEDPPCLPPSPAAFLRAPSSACLPTQAPRRGKAGEHLVCERGCGFGAEIREEQLKAVLNHTALHTQRPWKRLLRAGLAGRSTKVAEKKIPS